MAAHRTPACSPLLPGSGHSMEQCEQESEQDSTCHQPHHYGIDRPVSFSRVSVLLSASNNPVGTAVRFIHSQLGVPFSSRNVSVVLPTEIVRASTRLPSANFTWEPVTSISSPLRNLKSNNATNET